VSSSTILSVVTFVYGLSAVLYIVSWIFGSEQSGKFASFAAIFATAGNAAGIVLRWIESYKLGFGHAPLSNLYESLVFFSLTLGIIYLVIEYKYENRLIGAFAMPIACLSMAYASLGVRSKIQPLIPALKSNWLIAHVLTCFLGYAAFAIAFGVSIMYLFRQNEPAGADRSSARLPGAGMLDELTHQMVMFGFLFLSAGIITGAIWANSAWGTYWSWDPKETWSLITWFVYAALLHARLMRGWHGKRIAYISIVGFMAVLFTYFGVNFLPGLHSYGSQ
jgi:cytochrome c-type biogenesis protein CcsB